MMTQRILLGMVTILLTAMSARAETSIKDRVFQEILEVGGWSSDADDNGGKERIKSATLSEAIHQFKAAKKSFDEKCGQEKPSSECENSKCGNLRPYRSLGAKARLKRS